MHWTLITSYNVKTSILHFNLLLTQYIVSKYNSSILYLYGQLWKIQNTRKFIHQYEIYAR